MLDDVDPILRKVHPAISMARLVSTLSYLVVASCSSFAYAAAAASTSSLEPPCSMLLRRTSALMRCSCTLSMLLVRLVAKASSHASISVDMVSLLRMDVWIPGVVDLVRGLWLV